MLEAMACGVPVITSSTSSMPEIAGQAACIIDPSQPEDITAALYRLTNDKSYRDELIKTGLSRHRNFPGEPWQKRSLPFTVKSGLKEIIKVMLNQRT